MEGVPYTHTHTHTRAHTTGSAFKMAQRAVITLKMHRLVGFFSPDDFTQFGQWPHLYGKQMDHGLLPSGPSPKHAHLSRLVLAILW